MSGPLEVVQSHPPDWDDVPAPAAAWLLGWVRTDVPGFREYGSDGQFFVVASGTYRFDQYLAAIDTARGGVDTVTPWSAWGAYDDGSATTLFDAFPDRLGWLIGSGNDAGFVATGQGVFPYAVPPGGIPLMGATWTQVTRAQERNDVLDRHRRNQGTVWGGALLFRCKLTMHRWSFEALHAGYLLRSKVTLACADMFDTPLDADNPSGAITGYVVGVESVQWLGGPLQEHAVVELVIATS